ncbi:hypothetical protein BNJ_00049 [Kaumoebavirus]|uniref:hypothetical protein n=1 Tax=Kaumoebavirus TaxID=1859492 RepID=UPI0009C3854F|nr:hypothetical protein BNJ_00049 [Kaumoebavirus]ARA71892.1 hypothetical protein BNJ_00049 [Kaumoebavirus]
MTDLQRAITYSPDPVVREILDEKKKTGQSLTDTDVEAILLNTNDPRIRQAVADARLVDEQTGQVVASSGQIGAITEGVNRSLKSASELTKSGSSFLSFVIKMPFIIATLIVAIITLAISGIILASDEPQAGYFGVFVGLVLLGIAAALYFKR